jgi:hypothetical protein
MKKLATYPRLVFVLFFLICYGITYSIGVKNPLLRTVFSITLALVISPRKKKITTQTGEKTQITWVFLKEPIILN